MAKAAPTKKTSAKPAAACRGQAKRDRKAGHTGQSGRQEAARDGQGGTRQGVPRSRPRPRRPPRQEAGGQARGQGAREGPGEAARPSRPGEASAAKPGAAKKAPAKAAPPAKAAAKAPAKPAPAPKPAPVKKKTTVTCPLSGFEVKPDKPGLSPRTVDRLRLKLLEERARHVHQADELQAEAESLANDREGGDTQFDEESGEGDTFNIERERDLLLSATARQIVDEIDRALERIKNKTYGVCVPAGRRISLERLDALPYAETCVECKARAERRR